MSMTVLPPRPRTSSACHQGGGTGELSHYDRIDQITPDYPADVVLASGFNSNINGPATYEDNELQIDWQTCSGVSCHGGLITSNWYTGSIDVNTDCTNCHSAGTADRVNSEYNSYYSGEHTKHVDGESLFCTECHNTTELVKTHFTDLVDPTQWLDTAGATIGGAGTSIPDTAGGERNYDELTNSCSPACHGTETW